MSMKKYKLTALYNGYSRLDFVLIRSDETIEQAQQRLSNKYHTEKILLELVG